MSYELTSNVFVNGRWFGPDYPDAGDPPAGAVTNPVAFADRDEDTGEVLRDDDGNPTIDGSPVEIEQPDDGVAPRAEGGFTAEQNADRAAGARPRSKQQ